MKITIIDKELVFIKINGQWVAKNEKKAKFLKINNQTIIEVLDAIIDDANQEEVDINKELPITRSNIIQLMLVSMLTEIEKGDYKCLENNQKQ